MSDDNNNSVPQVPQVPHQKRVVRKPLGRPPGSRSAKPKHRMLFMPVITNKILDAVRSGATKDLAAQYAGIHSRTLGAWLKEGEQRPEDDPMHQFYLEYHRARGEKAKITLERLQQIAESVNSWQGLAWLLEHSFPQEFGRGIFGGAPGETPEIRHVIEVKRDDSDALPRLTEGPGTTRYQLSGPEDSSDDSQVEFPVISPVVEDSDTA